jgi:hypothetical protein
MAFVRFLSRSCSPPRPRPPTRPDPRRVLNRPLLKGKRPCSWARRPWTCSGSRETCQTGYHLPAPATGQELPVPHQEDSKCRQLSIRMGCPSARSERCDEACRSQALLCCVSVRGTKASMCLPPQEPREGRPGRDAARVVERADRHNQSVSTESTRTRHSQPPFPPPAPPWATGMRCVLLHRAPLPSSCDPAAFTVSMCVAAAAAPPPHALRTRQSCRRPWHCRTTATACMS